MALGRLLRAPAPSSQGPYSSFAVGWVLRPRGIGSRRNMSNMSTFAFNEFSTRQPEGLAADQITHIEMLHTHTPHQQRRCIHGEGILVGLGASCMPAVGACSSISPSMELFNQPKSCSVGMFQCACQPLLISPQRMMNSPHRFPTQ